MDASEPKYGALFTPWEIGSVEIKDCIVLCPMGVHLCLDGAHRQSLRQGGGKVLPEKGAEQRGTDYPWDRVHPFRL